MFKNKYILVLPSWYPSKLDAFNGDFNERLVHAISSYHDQVIVYVSSKKKSVLKEIELFEEGNITTYKAYFPNSKYKILNVLRMISLYYKILKAVFKKYGLPQLVHNYVFFPSGIISIYLKYRYNLKVVLTEHYSLFNYADNPKYNIYTKPKSLQLLYYFILNSFDVIIAVSESLSNSLSEWNKRAKRYVLPNVVDINYFYLNKNKSISQVFNFIHVSNFGPHKNVEAILESFRNVLQRGLVANLILIGNGNKEIRNVIDSDDLLKKYVKLLGEISYQEVANYMRKADAFILFSKYENMPCVILEALCCGLPVISSKVGGVATVVNPPFNGILVEKDNQSQLEEAILEMKNNYSQFKPEIISAKAIELYNYNNIGKRTSDIYSETLSHSYLIK